MRYPGGHRQPRPKGGLSHAPWFEGFISSPGGRVVTTALVASTGGHLKQLVAFRPRLQGIDDHVVWITYDTPQSRSLLGDEEVRFVRYTSPRDVKNVIWNLPQVVTILREHPIRNVVTTGAQVSLSVLPLAIARRIPCHFIESAARSHGPSLTGRLLRPLPNITYYTQYRWNVTRSTHFAGSVFDGFQSRRAAAPKDVRRVVVTLGTIEGYGFRRLLERLLGILPEGVEVLWQTGATDTTGLAIPAIRSLPAADLEHALRASDVVVAHAGTGTALSALEVGKCPILVPRRAAHGEHVDDHQLQIAGELVQRGLAVTREVEDLTFDDLVSASGREIVRIEPPPFELIAAHRRTSNRSRRSGVNSRGGGGLSRSGLH